MPFYCLNLIDNWGYKFTGFLNFFLSRNNLFCVSFRNLLRFLLLVCNSHAMQSSANEKIDRAYSRIGVASDAIAGSVDRRTTRDNGATNHNKSQCCQFYKCCSRSNTGI